MEVMVCDVCGKAVAPSGLKGREEFLQRHKDGIFEPHYTRAIVDGKGKVVGFAYCDAYVCQDCVEIANEAIWKAFEPVISNRRKLASIRTRKLPFEPDVRGDPPENPF